MNKIALIFIVGILTSFFYFPIFILGIPANTKMMLAVLGILIFTISATRDGKMMFDNDLFILTISAVLFSFICLISAVFNGTPDYTYATYFASMWTWLGGAYTVCQLIKGLHGKISVELVSQYIVGVCVAQCILALAIDMIPAVKNFVDTYFQTDQGTAARLDRLYGIGAELDTAGVRFSIALVLLAQLITTVKEKVNVYLAIYLAAFFILTVIGSMVARTTYVGVALAGAMILIKQAFIRKQFSSMSSFYWWTFWIVLIGVPIVVYYYNHNDTIYSNLRFAFEGFFNYFENGEWNISSNDKLETMVVWPDNMKTWLIGDGYFMGAFNDPYYTGDVQGFYYMDSDIGYVRFIFYCGLIGLAAFSFFFYQCTACCIKRFPSKGLMFSLLFVMVFIIWAKVATDIFLIFALFLTMGVEEEKEKETLSDHLGSQQSMLEGMKRL